MSNIAEQLQQTIAKGLPHKELIDKCVELHLFFQIETLPLDSNQFSMRLPKMLPNPKSSSI